MSATVSRSISSAYLTATLTRFVNRHLASQIDQLMP
jgi:hypothetical protein